MKGTPLVSVVMITYKHEKYIQQAVEGVLMQQCSFAVELIIADDNSPDNTEAIVNQLINNHLKSNWIKYTKHQINKGMTPNFIWAMQQCKSKYIAICEGDDYWTDPLKLQKQVDFLESNKGVVICGTQVKRLPKEKELQRQNNIELISEKNFFFTRNDFLKYNPLDTCSVVFRNMVIPENLLKGYSAPDWVLYAFLMNKGVGCKLNFESAVYNFHGNGVASSLTHNAYLYNRLKDKLLFIQSNINDKKIIKKSGLIIIWNYFKQAIRLRKVFIKGLIKNRALIYAYVIS